MNEKGSILSTDKPETRLQKSMRGVLNGLLLALLAFGLGALLIALALYFPTRQKLEKANADLEAANATISEQAGQISKLQADNEALQEDLVSTTLQVHVLKALSGGRAASLAIAADDYAGARLSLTQASEALDALSGLVEADQKDVLSAMQKSAAQALTDMQANLTSAQPELDRLLKNLEQLESSLFPNP